MRKITFEVSEAFEGVCVRGFLRRHCGVSARQLAKLKRLPDGITRNGQHTIATDILNAGDKVSITFPDDKKLPAPASLPVVTVYEDEDLLILNKPAAMPMYPTPGHDCDSLANAVAYMQLEAGSTFSYRPVYRLDKDTTGLVLLAKNAYAASRLSGTAKKTYLAVCEGILRGSGLIDRPIGLKPGHTIQRAVVPDGERAVTRWRSVFNGKAHSLIAIHLKTGRTHQIRVHFSDFGYPLAGDDMYGGSLANINRQALHCAEIRFMHPVTGKCMRIRSILPQDMLDLVKSDRNLNE
ncbi:MAG TPA: RluA family pseudouridine synthase [Caproicibacter sp.]|nr:RluA family pseudouridine synthase [Caproicibacter sp.]